MLRISQTEISAALTLKLEGKLLKPWVSEVRRSIEGARGHQTLLLDLSHVTFVDAAGTELLRSLLAGGAEIIACSSFVAEILNLEAP